MYTEREERVYILTDGEPDGYYRGERILACSSKKEQLEEYKKKLIEKGWEIEELEIEYKEYRGWENVERVENKRIEVYCGELYTREEVEKQRYIKESVMSILESINSQGGETNGESRRVKEIYGEVSRYAS